jgi:hypothetical protein
MKILSQDSLYPSRDLNPGPPNTKPKILISQPRRSVSATISKIQIQVPDFLLSP